MISVMVKKGGGSKLFIYLNVIGLACISILSHLQNQQLHTLDNNNTTPLNPWKIIFNLTVFVVNKDLVLTLI